MEAEQRANTNDLLVTRIQLALNGFGSLSSDPGSCAPNERTPANAGNAAVGCYFFNPFTNSVAVSAINNQPNPFYRGGANPADLARRYRNRISHVHTKDVRKDVMERSKAQGWSFLDSVIEGVYTVPGDGMVDFTSVFKELPGYSGWVIIEAEQDPKKAHPLTYAKMGYANLTRFLKEAGLR